MRKKYVNLSVCITSKCRKPKAKGSNYCHSCNKEHYKLAHPVKYSYQVLRQNAKRRGKDFELTFQQFEQFCYETQILAGRGRTADSFHIDRIDNERGYCLDNIQVLTNRENSQKEAKRQKLLNYDFYTRRGSYWELKPGPAAYENGCPF